MAVSGSVAYLFSYFASGTNLSLTVRATGLYWRLGEYWADGSPISASGRPEDGLMPEPTTLLPVSQSHLNQPIDTSAPAQGPQSLGSDLTAGTNTSNAASAYGSEWLSDSWLGERSDSLLQETPTDLDPLESFYFG